MIILKIIVALVLLWGSYKLGKRKGVAEGSVICDDCSMELIERGYDMGMTDANAMFKAQKEAELASMKSPKTVTKKAAKKTAKK